MVAGHRPTKMAAPARPDFAAIFAEKRILCNRYINGGDCYGQREGCLSVDQDSGSSRHKTSHSLKQKCHHLARVTCTRCEMVSCGHCLSSLYRDRCPNCGTALQSSSNSEPTTDYGWYKHNLGCIGQMVDGKRLSKKDYSCRRCTCKFD